MTIPDPKFDELKRQHAAEISALNAQHAAMLHHAQSSLSYRIGETLVDLRSKQGRRKFPKRVRSIVSEVRQDRKPKSVPMLSDRVSSRDLHVLSILDEFSEACLQPELRLRPVTKSDWATGLQGADFVFTETAWRGNSGQWSYAFSKFASETELPKMLSAAAEASVPTVIWNKEDPVNYDIFLPVVQSFDHVFTTDSAKVPQYKADLGHNRVHSLMFAAQPWIHNPIGSPATKQPSVCFAGAWRGAKYPNRARTLGPLLDAADQVGELVIYDREPTTSVATFPPRFSKAIVGTLPYADMLAAYRHHACFLNVNSVTESPTMLSRRVFEILACRTPVISTPSAALERHFADIVPMPTTQASAEAFIGQLLHDPDYRDRLGQRGYREVMSRHTYAHRVRQMLTAIDIDDPTPTNDEIVDVICVSNRPEFLDDAIRNYTRQSYPHKRFIFVMNSDRFDEDAVRNRLSEIPDARVLSLPEHLTLGECLNEAIQLCTGTWWAKFDDDDRYGVEYLGDMFLCTQFTDADIFGKRTFHAYVEAADATMLRHEGYEFSPTNLVMGGTLLVRRLAVASISFQSVVQGTDTRFLRSCTQAGLTIFSTDRFNYLMNRRSNPQTHTWTISDQDFMKHSRPIGTGQCLSSVEP
jgi:spore maturation protein CgeB